MPTNGFDTTLMSPRKCMKKFSCQNKCQTPLRKEMSHQKAYIFYFLTFFVIKLYS